MKIFYEGSKLEMIEEISSDGETISHFSTKEHGNNFDCESIMIVNGGGDQFVPWARIIDINGNVLDYNLAKATMTIPSGE